ncbi:MAG TPA: hypothetical protein VMN36_00515 [Verrucomicrobiales bacterium]|nr:hypothetical protein [Verrucomicrobiales bacterium]
MVVARGEDPVRRETEKPAEFAQHAAFVVIRVRETEIDGVALVADGVMALRAAFNEGADGVHFFIGGGDDIGRFIRAVVDETCGGVTFDVPSDEAKEGAVFPDEPRVGGVTADVPIAEVAPVVIVGAGPVEFPFPGH